MEEMGEKSELDESAILAVVGVPTFFFVRKRGVLAIHRCSKTNFWKWQG
jgi:hypothetical protein